MAKQLITWQEKVSVTAYDTIYPETLPEQVHINNEIANNLGISPDVALDTALEKLSATDKVIRAQGIAGGTATAITLSVNVFTLFDGVVVRVKILFDTEPGVTLNVNNTGAKPLIRLDGQPFDLTLRQGVWATLMYSAGLDGWCVQGWSGKLTSHTQVFTKSGTWTVPSGVTAINVLVMGGGSGGFNGDGYGEDTGSGAAGGGGAGGEMALKSLNVVSGNSYVITIGKGGAAGKAGGTTSFGTLLSANGGGVAQYVQYGSSGGTGGGASTGYGTHAGNGSYGGGGGAGGIGPAVRSSPGTGATNNGEEGSETSGGAGGKGLAIAGGTGAGGAGGTTTMSGQGGGGGGGGYGGMGGAGGNGDWYGQGGGGGGGGYGLNGNGGKGGDALASGASQSGTNGGIAAGGGGGGGAGYRQTSGHSGGQGGSGGDGICIVTWTSIDG